MIYNKGKFWRVCEILSRNLFPYSASCWRLARNELMGRGLTWNLHSRRNLNRDINDLKFRMQWAGSGGLHDDLETVMMRISLSYDYTSYKYIRSEVSTRASLLVALPAYNVAMYLQVLRLRSLWWCNSKEKTKEQHASRQREKMGGLIFYYIWDTHNIQKRQAGAQAHREKLYYITLFSCSHLFRLHVQENENEKFQMKRMKSFITVKYIIECLMLMQIYQFNLMCFLEKNLSLRLAKNVSCLVYLSLLWNQIKANYYKSVVLTCVELNL